MLNQNKIQERIINAIQARATRSVFLGVREQGLRLAFGLNVTTIARFWISLQWPGGGASFGSDDPKQQQFTLLMDQPELGKSLRLMIFGAKTDAPLLVYDGREAESPDLCGEILILATSPNQKDVAVISAIFDGQGHDSFICDGAAETGRHLKMMTDLHQQEILAVRQLYREEDETYESDPFVDSGFPPF